MSDNQAVHIKAPQQFKQLIELFFTLQKGHLRAGPCATHLWVVQKSLRSKGEDIIVREGASGIQEAHTFRWRDAMDIIVKWRQLAEPNDQVSPQKGSWQ